MPVVQHRAGRRRLARLAAAAVCAAGLAVAPAASPSAASPAQEDPVRPLPRPTARLQLTLTPAEGGAATAEGGPPPATVTLTCNPDGGTHPTPRDACDSLRRVNGHFELLPWHPAIDCPDLWDPHTARATGYWLSSPRGPIRIVRYEETFGNRCLAAAATDLVFGF